MARAPFTITVLEPDGDVKVGASVTVKVRASGANATVYAAETGAGTLSNPLSTDAAGRAAGWLDRGAYRHDVTGSGITAYSVNFDASPAADGAVDTAWLSSSAVPIGGLMPYGGASDPAGGYWLVCDGRAISRSTYAGLFNVLGTAYGVGDGSTTFNIPDVRGRAPIGAGQGSGLTNRVRGAAGGAESVVLTDAQMPDSNIGNSGTPLVYLQGGPAGTGGPLAIPTSGSGNANYAVNNTATGGGSAHENMPPFVALSYIIRAL